MAKPCTTPWKRVYDTRPDAEFARTEDGIRYGTALFPYECICGKWHLSRSTDQDLPAYEPADPANVARIRVLTGGAFMRLVDSDAKNTASIADRLALRHPDNLTRWRWALKSLHAKVSRQLVENPQACEWRTWAEHYRDTLDMRLTECRRLRAEAAQSRSHARSA